MGKLLAAVTAAAGGTAVTVGGSYLLQQEKGTGQTPVKEEIKTDELDSFKKDNQSNYCVQNVFSSVENLSTLQDSGELPQNDTTFFGNVPTEENKAKGCLLIDIDKNEYTSGSNTKWSGKFAWTWSFMNDNKGFITFNVAKSSPSNKQLNLLGGFYLLEKIDDKWKIKHHKEVKESVGKKITSSTDFDSTFPKFKTSVNVFNNVEFFIESGSKLSDICGTDDCKGNTTKENKKNSKWTWKKDSGNDNVGDWDEKNLKWFEHIYEKTPFDLGDKIKGFSGTWKKEDNGATT